MLSFGDRKLSMESYKGVRDFYPEDKALQKRIFKVLREKVESWGYEEYDASPLEPAELYRKKSSQEIVDEQTYTFTDRGGREVTLRPEMTPTVARMISYKSQEIPFPARWYSIPNLFRYEKPQRGRLREHFQLNVDLFGSSGVFADAEIINIASDILTSFGAKPDMFVIKINNRGLLDDLLQKLDIKSAYKQPIFRLLDKKEKMKEDDFKKAIVELLGEENAKNFLEMLYYGEALLTMMPESQSASYLNKVIDTLRLWGIGNIQFSPTLTRGFDYYTGIVFEVFDTNKENPRSLFGGGRYDNLTQNFIKTDIAAIGFGMGDVTLKDFLETHGLVPVGSSIIDLWLAVTPEIDMREIYLLAQKLRSYGIKVAIDISGKKLSDQLKLLEKRKTKFVIVVGSLELSSGNFVLRNVETREEKKVSLEEIIECVK